MLTCFATPGNLSLAYHKPCTTCMQRARVVPDAAAALQVMLQRLRMYATCLRLHLRSPVSARWQHIDGTQHAVQHPRQPGIERLARVAGRCQQRGKVRLGVRRRTPRIQAQQLQIQVHCSSCSGAAAVAFCVQGCWQWCGATARRCSEAVESSLDRRAAALSIPTVQLQR